MREMLNQAAIAAYTPTLFRVQKVVKELSDTYTFHFAKEKNKFNFLPGQFNMLYAFGVGEIAISISGGNETSLVHTIREVGAVSAKLCRLKENDTVGIRGPYGSPWPIREQKGKNVIVMAGGIGLAPLRPLIYYLLGNRDSFEKVWLLYGAKDQASVLYPQELEAWQAKIDVHQTIDQGGPTWPFKVGVVTTLLKDISINNGANTAAFLCGPEIMMRFSLRKLRQLGLSEENVFLSMERNMKCAVGLCGHCQYGSYFMCKEGPVFSYSQIKSIFDVREI